MAAAPLFVGPQLLGADHAGVEETGLVERLRLLFLDLPLPLLLDVRLLLVLVVGGLLVVPLLRVGRVRVGLLVAVRVLLLGVLLLIAVRVLLLVLVGVRLLLLAVRRLLGGHLGALVGLLRGLGQIGEAGQVVGVAGVQARRPVLAEGGQVAEVVAGDPAVQLLAAAADGLQRLGEDGLEGAELDVDVFVGVAAQGLRVVAALGGVLVLVALLVDARAGTEELRGRGRPSRGSW